MGKKILKKLAFCSLAVCFGALTLLGTACTPTQGIQSPQIPTISEMTTESAGLIYPKAEDPTLYTTESGIEIKFGLSSLDIESSLLTGNLKGFPYFTTTSGGTNYTWVIIGQAEDKPLGTSKPTSFSFSSWTSLSDYYANKKYYNENIKDTTTPAGSAINAVSPSKAYVIDSSNFGNLKSNTEIPSGCVLVLANNSVGTGVYNTSYASYNANSCNRYQGTYTGSENIAKTMKGYYDNQSFGLSKVIANIQTITLSTYTYYYYNEASNYYTNTLSANIFALGGNSSSKFNWQNYLSASQVKISTNQWIRGNMEENTDNTMTSNGSVLYRVTTVIDSSGNHAQVYCNNSSVGYRPAFVLEI